VAISSATKNKLNIFHFGAQSNVPTADESAAMQTFTESSDDKENAVLEKKPENLDTGVGQVSKVSSQYDSANPRTNAPTTPAGRLALPDLIGMVDVQTIHQEISPDERIMWDHNANAAHSSASSYGVLKRVKKRARSSSPLSSPAQSSAHFSGRSEALDFHRLNLSLKTPQRDPGNDLWGRYGDPVEEPITGGPQLPALAHIMYTSSPQSSREVIMPRGEGSLRKSIGRSNSCGTDWPKRRKIASTEEHALDDVFTESFNVGPSKLSLVSALLGKVQEGYGSAGKPKRTMEPSSSSPLENTPFPSLREESSPLRQVRSQPTVPSSDVKFPIGRPSLGNVKPADATNLLKDYSSSSDYGDFDDEAFDERMVEVSNTNPASMSAMIPGRSTQMQLPSLDEVRVAHAADMETTSNPASQNNEDEFGGMDEDVCPEELESMVARYDSGLPVEDSISSGSAEAGRGVDAQASKSLAQKKLSRADSEDEFGDEFSDLDFEAAEAAATQSLEHSAGSSAPVRIRFL
jgi:hypothetical protein